MKLVKFSAMERAGANQVGRYVCRSPEGRNCGRITVLTYAELGEAHRGATRLALRRESGENIQNRGQALPGGGTADYIEPAAQLYQRGVLVVLYDGSSDTMTNALRASLGPQSI